MVAAIRGTAKDESDEVERILAAVKRGKAVLVMDDVVAVLEEVTKDGAAVALMQIGLQDDESIVSQVNEASVRWASERGAEMVGKKWVDGELVDNPNAEWVIDEATRDMLRADVTRATEEGWSTDQLADSIAENYAFSDERAEVIARTETAFADVAGNMEAYRASEVVAGKQWLAAPDCCDDCQELDGEVVDLDEQFSDGSDGPPAHPNCFSGDAVVTAVGVTAYFKRWFEGEVIVIGLPGVDDITVTPNHPVLTPNGWVAAGSLKAGDDVLQCLSPSAALAGVYPDNDHVEARFEDVARSPLVTGGVPTGSVPLTAEHFHGDGVVDTEVDVVRAAGALRDYGAEVQQNAANCALCGREILQRKRLLPNDGSLRERLSRSLRASDSRMGRRYEALSLSDGSASEAVDHAVAHGLDRQTEGAEPLAHGEAAATDAPSYINARLAGHVTTVQIAHLSVRKFEGHVYNLSTREGWYVASSLIAHNCRCNFLPVLTPADE